MDGVDVRIEGGDIDCREATPVYDAAKSGDLGPAWRRGGEWRKNSGGRVHHRL